MSDGAERHGRPTGEMDELAERMKRQPEIEGRIDALSANAAAPGEAG